MSSIEAIEVHINTINKNSSKAPSVNKIAISFFYGREEVEFTRAIKSFSNKDRRYGLSLKWSVFSSRTSYPLQLPSSSAQTRRDFRTRRDFFASMETVFEHGNGLNSRLVVADEDNISPSYGT